MSFCIQPTRLCACVWLVLLLAIVWGGNTAYAGTAGISQTPRGAVVETDRYRAVITNGVITTFRNKLTGEEYLDAHAQLDKIVPHLPSGLGTQATDREREAARKLFEWPWWEQPAEATWPNHHYPDATSTVDFTRLDAQHSTLTYTGLTNGTERFADETFVLEVGIDAPTGDLLITPSVASPRGGVYGCGMTVSALAPAITAEAPIFEGMRLDRQMQPKLWVNAWANFWDYAFLALNGQKTGAVGIWCQDADLKLYKTLFYLNNDQGLSLSFLAMNVPPFDELKSAKPITWRLQAFDKSWAQAAARFRNWRLNNVKIAPRPEWVKKLSFMYYGMDKAHPGDSLVLEKYFEGKDLDRVITWAPAVRAAGFDRNHANNTPYPGFKEDMQGWKAKNLMVMVYLQPMIMWGPDPKTERERKAVEFSKLANTHSPFRANHDIVDLTHDQHHLGQPDWQRWFLDWVKEYIQDDGADGIYHDQSYACPLDVRGVAVNGMTSPQGMADYFYKAATENPNAIHGTEHMMEANNVGASLGLGCGILWGTPGYQGKIGPPGSMNWQRIREASPISNALHYPNGAIFGFPHMSDYSANGALKFHDGMDQMERRGDLPAIPLGSYYGLIQNIPFAQWANEVWLDRQRAVLFVRHGLRAVFPEDWNRNVLSYFQGANGEDFRYEQMPWGTAFMQYTGNKRMLHYGRVTGVTHADVAAGIVAWPCYDKNGPAGLNPSSRYILDPACPRPAVYFAVPSDTVYVSEGFSNDALAFMQLQPLKAGAPECKSVLLSAPVLPKAVWVDGLLVAPKARAGNRWEIPATNTACIVALLQDPPVGFTPLNPHAIISRFVDPVTRRDIIRAEFLSPDAALQQNTLVLGEKTRNIYSPAGERQSYMPLKAPLDNDGVLHITTGKQPAACRLNGKAITFAPAGNNQPGFTLDVPLKAGEVVVLGLSSAGSFTFKWDATALTGK